MSIVNVLTVGDVCGEPGLDFLRSKLRGIIKLKGISLTIVNGENANGIGITPDQAEDIFSAGADVVTLGNHTWGRREIKTYLDDCKYILRPANYAPQCPGRGFLELDMPFGKVCVVNLMGRFEMDCNLDNPFFSADKIISQTQAKIILLDMHAEATSERQAMGYYLDGRASAVWGTHTHVQTSDGRVLPKGTGFVSDLGMTGVINSILGMKPEQSISMFLGNPPTRFESAKGDSKLECAVFQIDTDTGKCLDVETLRII